MTPSVVVNGILDPSLDSSYSAEAWKAYLAKLG
jgi:hypothetical protein